ncbi:MAG TPA: hypothetical protein VI298_08130 [Geobacteraceae bacterium]
MKWRYAIHLLVLIIAGCGGGGSSSTSTAAITLTAKSPVLVTYTSNRVQAAFPSVAAVPDGTPVVFTASSPNISLLPATATVAGGAATVRVKSSVPGKYRISATTTVGATVYTGSALVTFIDQPSSVQLSIALQPPVGNLGGLQFSILNDPGISAFQNFTSLNPGFFAFTNLSSGQAPPGNRTNVAAISATGVDVTSTAALFRLTYSIGANGGLPGFAIDPASILAVSANGNTITPAPAFLTSWKYDTDIF